MERLQDSINLIEEKIIGMAHIQELPHDLFRRESEFSDIAIGRIMSKHPELAILNKELNQAQATAMGIFSKSDNKPAAYQFIESCITKAEMQIKKAANAQHEAELDIKRNEAAYQETIRNHSVALLSDFEMDAQDIDLAAINQTAATQRLKNAINAVSLLTFKLNIFKKIKATISKQALKDYYAELYGEVEAELKVFSAKFDQLKAAALLAFPDAETFNDAKLLNRKDSERIKSEVVEMVESLCHFPPSDYQTILKRTIAESLTSDPDENALLDKIGITYQAKLDEWNSSGREEPASNNFPPAQQRAKAEKVRSEMRQQKYGADAPLSPRPHGI